MSKQNQQRHQEKRAQQQRQQQMMMIVGALIVTALVIAFFTIFSQSSDPGAVAVTDISATDYQNQFMADGSEHLLLDVRTPQEFADEHIAGAVNISVQTLASRLDELPQDQPIVVYCRSGNRSVTATQILADAGYSKVYDMGGIIDWKAQGYPVE